MITLKKFFSCQQSAVPNTYQGYFAFSFEPYLSAGWICEAVTSPPSGFIELVDANDVLYGYTVIGAAAGVYNITIQAANFGGTYTQYNLEFTFQSECSAEQSVCCEEESLNIRWLGREGAIKQWSFTGVKTYDVRVGDANSFKNNDRQLQYSERKNIYNGKVISSGSISKVQADFLDELKYSIQAWEYDGTDFIPIYINNDSFDKYKSNQKFYDVSLAYVIAEAVQIQTQ